MEGKIPCKSNKNLLIAYLLLFLLGPVGCHNFYVERKKLARTELFLLCSSIVCFLGSVLYGSSFFHAGALVDAAVDISGTVDNAKTVAWVAVYIILAIIMLAILLLCDLFSLPSAIRKTNANRLNAEDLTKKLATSATAGVATGVISSEALSKEESAPEEFISSEEADKLVEGVGMTISEAIENILES